MSNHCSTTVSEHDLNAWVDGELVEPEHSEVAAALSACPELTARVCALQTLKGLLQLAYPGSAAHGSTANHPHKTGSHD